MDYPFSTDFGSHSAAPTSAGSFSPVTPHSSTAYPVVHLSGQGDSVTTRKRALTGSDGAKGTSSKVHPYSSARQAAQPYSYARTSNRRISVSVSGAGQGPSSSVSPVNRGQVKNHSQRFASWNAAGR